VDVLEQTALLAEYRANVELWKHDDTLRQSRTSNFLTINAILASSIGISVGLNPSALAWIAALITSFVGLVLARFWAAIQDRNAEYVRLRRYQLRSIEAEFPRLTTFSNVWAALYQHQAVTFLGIADRFEVSSRGRESSTLTESALPRILFRVWVVVFVAALSVGVAVLARSALVPDSPPRPAYVRPLDDSATTLLHRLHVTEVRLLRVDVQGAVT
jgi:hypothetical protein